MSDWFEIEIEIDGELAKERRWREKQYMSAGIGEFVAFRLAMVPQLDWHRVVEIKKRGATDEGLIAAFLD